MNRPGEPKDPAHRTDHSEDSEEEVFPGGLSRAEAEALGLVPVADPEPDYTSAEAETPLDSWSEVPPPAEDAYADEGGESPDWQGYEAGPEVSDDGAGSYGAADPEPFHDGFGSGPFEPDGLGDWYALRVQSNKEDTVRRNMTRRIELRGLQHKITEIVVPTEKLAEIKNGKKRTRQVKTYPGYVLVRMVMDDETWAFVRETAGVGDFVGGGTTVDQKPFPLRPDEVNKIFGIEAPTAELAPIKIDFGVGDKVKIREGAFENFDGIVEEIDEMKGRVKVVVTIFGRATPVDLQFMQVELI